MALQQKVILIADKEHRITTLPSSMSVTLFFTVLKLLAGAGDGVKDWPQTREEFDEAFHFGHMVQGIFEGLNPKEGAELIKGIIRASMVEFYGSTKDRPFEDWYEEVFSSALDQLADLVVAILEFNFGSLLEWGKKLWAGAVAVPPAGSNEASPKSGRGKILKPPRS